MKMNDDVRSAGSPSVISHQSSSGTGGQWVAVCQLEDIVPNTGVCALVGAQQVAVFRIDDDSVYAVGNHDPYSRANVLSRGIVGDVKGMLVVASPVYKQHFSLASGECIEDPTVRIPVFRVRLDDGAVWVETQGGE
jgi:nitrite reductase (NADH) small subunit